MGFLPAHSLWLDICSEDLLGQASAIGKKTHDYPVVDSPWARILLGIWMMTFPQESSVEVAMDIPCMPGAIRPTGAESPVPGPGPLLPPAPVEGHEHGLTQMRCTKTKSLG